MKKPILAVKKRGVLLEGGFYWSQYGTQIFLSVIVWNRQLTMSEEKWSKEELNHSTKKPKLQSETHKSPSEEPDEPKKPKPPSKNQKLSSWEQISSTKHQKLSRSDYSTQVCTAKKKFHIAEIFDGSVVI